MPAAKAALDLAGAAASAVQGPFAAALQAAADRCAPADEIADSGDELRDRIASRLGAILDAAGALPGESFQLHVEDDGRVRVAGSSLAVSAVQRALDEDPNLSAELAQLASAGRWSNDARDQPATLEVEAGLLGEPAIFRSA